MRRRRSSQVLPLRRLRGVTASVMSRKRSAHGAELILDNIPDQPEKRGQAKQKHRRFNPPTQVAFTDHA